jgi:hypothetical protein
MRSSPPLAGTLALASLLIGAGGFAAVLMRIGGVEMFAAFPVSALTATAAWLALGAPVSRRSLNRGGSGAAPPGRRQ